MIITCPECKTRYMIKSDKLGLDPKPVRCAKCKHEWTVNPTPKSSDIFSEKKPPLPPMARLSSPSLEKQQKELNQKLKKRKTVLLSFLIALFVGVLLSLIIFKNTVMQNYPSLTPVYEMVGFTAVTQQNNFTGLVIEGVERQQKETANMTMLTFSGKIKNVSDIELPVANVKVELFNEDGVLLDEWSVDPEHKTLKPGEVTTWFCVFYDPPLNDIAQFKTSFKESE